MSWKKEQIRSLLRPPKKTIKVPSSKYLKHGTTPVIDQSQKEISGYTNNPQARFESPLPVVLFGDHTRVLKYLDAPFARGSDGTQILVTDPQHVLPHYLFYALHTVDLSSYGYARHFKYLKEQYIPVPPLKVQQSIVNTLSVYDMLIQNNKRRMDLLEESLQLIYRKWFILLRFPGHKTTPFINGLPYGWRQCTVGEILTKIPRRTMIPQKKYCTEGPIPIIDQSRTFIGGYTHNQDALYDIPLPIIVFGDHTRILKFVDFPFARGADGTQILYPNNFISTQLLYFAISHIDLSSFGYARHFKYLKAESILIPPKPINNLFDKHSTPILRQIHTLRIKNQHINKARNILISRLIQRN